jgi:hypothetical protein
VLAPDVAATGPASLRAAHRFVDGREVYFLVNDGPSDWQGSVTLAVRGPGELWDPGTGRMTALQSGSGVPLRLGPYEAVFARFKTRAAPRRIAAPAGPLVPTATEGAQP